MRGAEDPPTSHHHVLQYGFGFEEVFACVEIKNGSRRCDAFKRRSSRVASGLRHRVTAKFMLSRRVMS